jgi:hypothetical protein
MLRHRHLLPLILAAMTLAPAARAADPPAKPAVAVESLKGGRIRIERVGRRKVVNLAREVSGCTGELYDLTTGERSEPAVEFELLDETEKDSQTYLLLLATAPPNCNVQGVCGAAEPDATILWVKLAKNLSPAETKAVVINSCAGFVTLSIDFGDELELHAADLPWTGDTLTVAFADGQDGPVRQLVYDRGNPAAGLRVLP